jgi:hypothetical protein
LSYAPVQAGYEEPRFLQSAKVLQEARRQFNPAPVVQPARIHAERWQNTWQQRLMGGVFHFLPSMATFGHN